MIKMDKFGFPQIVMPFNMSLATLERINDILKNLHEYNNMGHIQLIQRSLYSLFKEIYPFLNNSERHKASEFWNNISNGFFYDENNLLSIDMKVPILMNEFEFWLRDKLNEKGLLMSKGDDPFKAIG